MNYNKIILKKSLENSIFFLIIINLGNFLNFVSQFFLNRNLDFNSFGIYAVALNILSIFTAINIIIPIVIRNYFSLEKKLNLDKVRLLKKILIYSIIYWILASIIILFFKNNFLNVLNISDDRIVIFFIASIFSLNLLNILYGIYISIDELKLGAILNSLNPIIRFCLIIGFFYLITNEVIALLFTTFYASIFVVIISLVILLVKNKKLLKKLFFVKIKNLHIPLFFNFFGYIIIFSLIYNIDNIIVRYLYNDQLSAEYISMNLISKTIYFFVICLAPLVFSDLKKYESKIPLYFSIFLILIIGFIFFSIIGLYHKEISYLFFGPRYQNNTEIMIQLCLANMCFALLYFLILNKIVEKNYLNLAILSIVGLIYIFLLISIDQNLKLLSYIVLWSSIVFTIVMSIDFKKSKKYFNK